MALHKNVINHVKAKMIVTEIKIRHVEIEIHLKMKIIEEAKTNVEISIDIVEAAKESVAFNKRHLKSLHKEKRRKLAAIKKARIHLAVAANPEKAADHMENTIIAKTEHIQSLTEEIVEHTEKVTTIIEQITEIRIEIVRIEVVVTTTVEINAKEERQKMLEELLGKERHSIHIKKKVIKKNEKKIKVAKKMLKIAHKLSKPHTKAFKIHKKLNRKVKHVKKQAELEIRLAMQEISRKTILIQKYEAQKHSVFAKQLRASLKENNADIVRAKAIIESVEIQERAVEAIGGDIEINEQETESIQVVIVEVIQIIVEITSYIETKEEMITQMITSDGSQVKIKEMQEYVIMQKKKLGLKQKALVEHKEKKKVLINSSKKLHHKLSKKEVALKKSEKKMPKTKLKKKMSAKCRKN